MFGHSPESILHHQFQRRHHVFPAVVPAHRYKGRPRPNAFADQRFGRAEVRTTAPTGSIMRPGKRYALNTLP